MKRQKNEDFDVHVGWSVDRKERKKEKVNSKQNVRVSSQQMKEGAVWRRLTYLQPAGCLVIFR